jgi:hypothetical protein
VFSIINRHPVYVNGMPGCPLNRGKGPFSLNPYFY